MADANLLLAPVSWDSPGPFGLPPGSRKALLYLAQNYPVDYPELESLVHLQKQGLRTEKVPVNMFAHTTGRSSIHSLQSLYYMVKVTVAVLCVAMEKGAAA